jgi:hypothetical protein
MLRRIRRIGCVHFDEAGSADPLHTIKVALTNYAPDLSDTLIVLPEALDLGDKYLACTRTSRDAVPVFCARNLQAISREFNLAFVAGLTEKSCFHTYNSAFLIDPHRTVRLSRKMYGDDNAQWYKESYLTPRCISYRGLMLTCQICKDAQDFTPNATLHKRALKCLRSEQIQHSPILCVPARMTWAKPSCEATAWPQDVNVVVANIQPSDDWCSGIRLANGDWKPCLKMSERTALGVSDVGWFAII